MKTLVLAVAVAALAGCATQTKLSEPGRPFAQEEAAVHALRAANNQAMAARDLAGTMSIVADDYVIVAGNGEIIRSAEGIRAAWSDDFRQPNIGACVREPRSIEVGRVADVLRAAESGQWRCPMTTAAGDAVYFGSYFAHWDKRSGEWRVVSDTYVGLGCDGRGCRR
jgi:ketosteroid isomerase-like protein